MSKVDPTEQVPTGAVDIARHNLVLARKLDAIHPLGQTILSAFEHDVTIAELDNDEDERLINPSVTDIDTLLDSGDVELLERELEERANHSLSILGDLNDKDPGNYDWTHKRDIVRGNKGALSRNLLGSTLVVRRNWGDKEITARVVLVGGLRDEYPTPIWREVPPNPSVHTLNLRPFVNGDGVWSWYHGLGYDDMDQLGQTSNCYYREDTFMGPFMNAIGHARAYKIDLGIPTFEMPDTLTPVEIKVENPVSAIDHLVRNATEAVMIEERLRELKLLQPVAS